MKKKRWSADRKKAKPVKPKPLSEIEVHKHNFDALYQMRGLLMQGLRGKSGDDEGMKAVLEIDEAIREMQPLLFSEPVFVARYHVKELLENLRHIVAEADAEKLLENGDDNGAVRALNQFVAVRDGFVGVISKIPPSQNPAQIIEMCNAGIAEISAALEEKRATVRQRLSAERRQYEETQNLYRKVFPKHTDMRAALADKIKETPQTSLNADGSEYEMYEDYLDAAERLQAARDLRDLLKSQSLPEPTTKKQRKARVELEKSMIELDEMIVHLEGLQQKEKDTFQVLRRAQARADESITEYENALQNEIAGNPYLLLGNFKHKPKGQ